MRGRQRARQRERQRDRQRVNERQGDKEKRTGDDGGVALQRNELMNEVEKVIKIMIFTIARSRNENS